MSITVVNRHHQPYDVDITRAGEHGNPYVIGRDGSRARVVAKYELYLRQKLTAADGRRDAAMLRKLQRLNNQRLGCVCAPKLCHGDVLKYYIEWSVTAGDGSALPPLRFQDVPENKMPGLWSHDTRKRA